MFTFGLNDDELWLLAIGLAAGPALLNLAGITWDLTRVSASELPEHWNSREWGNLATFSYFTLLHAVMTFFFLAVFYKVPYFIPGALVVTGIRWLISRKHGRPAG